VRRGAVIVAFRDHEWLERAVASALAASDEVVVVDNGSDGETVSATARRLGARAVRLPSNRGFPAGVNAGVANLAAAEVIGLLNDDAIAAPDWIDRCTGVLAAGDVAAVSPRLLLAHPHAEVRLDDTPWFAPGDTRPLGRMLESATVGKQDVLSGILGAGIHRLEHDTSRRWRWTAGPEPFYVPLPDGAAAENLVLNGEPAAGAVVRVVDVVNNAGSYLSAEGHGGDYGFGAPDGPPFTEARDCFAACGAAMVFRRDTWDRLGPFCTSFFAYNEDTDWCWRARLAGMRIRYEPASVVRHVRQLSTGGSERFVLLAARNRYHMLARNAPLPVLRAQLRRLPEPHQPPGLAQAAWPRTLRGLAERVRLSRGWRVSPAEVFEIWAGVGETW
jgi:GT2 family glycosyltransferase